MSIKDPDLRKKISGKAITALISENANQAHESSFPKKAYRLVFENPHLLTPKWVRDINNWGEQIVSKFSSDSDSDSDSLLAPPNKALDIGPLRILKESKLKKTPILFSSHDISSLTKDYVAVHKFTGQKYWFRIHKSINIKDPPKADLFPSRNQIIILRKVWISGVEKDIQFIRTVRRFEVIKRKQ